MPSEAPAPQPTARHQSREERTLRALYGVTKLLAEQCHGTTHQHRAWGLLQDVERLINDCAAEETARAH